MSRVRQHLREIMSSVPAAGPLDCLDNLYESSRNRAHFGLTSRLRHQPQVVSLNPLLTLSAINASSSLSREQRSGGALMYNLLEQLCPSLNAYRFNHSWWPQPVLDSSDRFRGQSAEGGLAIPSELVPQGVVAGPLTSTQIEQEALRQSDAFKTLCGSVARDALERLSKENWFREYFDIDQYRKRVEWVIDSRPAKIPALAMKTISSCTTHVMK